ncbi:MAG: hypothetical protein IPG16_13800 [Comamonadaceae bacterium]|nr:hypothetical protein [Comamonadaceae bacterium]
MNPDALSDLVLLLVCAAILWFHLRQRPAVAVAAGLIGLAACLGVLRYSGWAEMLGPHRFTSLLAACAAFPLLASGLRWPDAPLATWRGGRAFCAGRGGVGIVLTLAGLALWSQVVPGVCALVIAWTAVQQRNTWGLAGTLALLGSFVVAATGKADSNYLGLFNTVQLMHYTLALALALLAVGATRTPQNQQLAAA